MRPSSPAGVVYREDTEEVLVVQDKFKVALGYDNGCFYLTNNVSPAVCEVEVPRRTG